MIPREVVVNWLRYKLTIFTGGLEIQLWLGTIGCNPRGFLWILGIL
jgi:hypothetical protein